MSCVNNKNYKYAVDVLAADAMERFGLTEERAKAWAEKDWENIVAENSSKEEYQVYTTLTSRGDRTVDVLFRGAEDGRTSVKVTGVDKHANGLTVYAQRGDSSYEFTFNNGQTRSTNFGNGNYVDMPMLSTVYNVYGSEEGYEFDDSLFERQELDLVNNLSNATKLFDKLSAIDNTVSATHNSRLKRVLGTIVDDMRTFIPDMNVFINDKAEKNGGVLAVGRGMYLGVSDKVRPVMNMMSAQEVYVHELIHAATDFAFEASGIAAQRAKMRLQQLRKQLRNEITVEDLMPAVSIDAVYEREIAQNAWNYMFSNEATGLKEFITYGLSNEAVANKLDALKVNKHLEAEPTNMLEAILYWLKEVINKAVVKIRRETFETTGTELLMQLTMELAEVNNKAIATADESSILGKFKESADELNDKMSRIIKDKILAIDSIMTLPRRPLTGAPKSEWIKFAWQIGPRLIADKRLRPAWREILMGLGMSYVGDVQTALTHAVSADTLQRAVEKLGLLSENIDKARETRARITADQVRKSFNEISKEEREALTLVALDTDMSSVYGVVENLQELLIDDVKLRSDIESRRRELKTMLGTADYNTIMYQVEGLGHYMATHTGGVNQVYNAQMIMNKVNRDSETQAELTMKIDQLATMYGLWYTPKEAKLVVGNLMIREPEGMKFTMSLHKAVVGMAKDTVFADSSSLMIKGYTKEIFDEDITMKVAPESEKLSMEKEGFKLVKVLSKAKGDTSEKQMAMYINKNHVQQNYKKAAMRLTDMNRKGTTLTDIRNIENDALGYRYAKRDIAAVELDAAKLDNQVAGGSVTFSPKYAGGLMPLYDGGGKVVNYRYMLDKRSKREILGQDIKGPTVLGRMQAAIEDKMSTQEHNDRIFDVMAKDMDENYMVGHSIGRNTQRYVVITPNSNNKEIAELYKLIPKDFREKIKGLANKELAVRADLLRFYFGMREANIEHLVGKIPGLGHAIVKMTPKEIRHAVQYAEMIWQAIVSIAKVDIVIRTPIVLIGNVVSNIMYSVQSGYSMATVMRMQLDSFRGLKEYIDMTHELIRLENLKMVGKLDKKDWDKITTLKEDIRQHPANELVDEGMFQAIIEDVGADEYKSTNKITKYLDGKMERMPKYVKDGAQWLYLTERTPFFKMMSTATQFSDFAARQVQHALNKEKLFAQIDSKSGDRIDANEFTWTIGEHSGLKTKDELKRMAVEYSRAQVLDAFVNYSKPEGKVVDWMNRMGLVMFTKYFMRIQRAIGKNFVDNPLYMITSILGQRMLTDIDSIDDQMLLVKDMKYLFKNPMDHLERLMMPSGLEFALNPIP